TDVYNQVFHSDTSSKTITSALTAYPDLTVVDLGISPASGLESGDMLTVVWSDANILGTAAVSSPFVDHVIITNTTTNQTLATQDLTYDPAAAGNGPIGAGQKTQPRHLTFTLPQGTPGAGLIQFTVITDYYNQLFEWNHDGPGGSSTGESNNTATVSTTAAL